MVGFIKNGCKSLCVRRCGDIWRITRHEDGKVISEFATNNRISAYEYWKISWKWLRSVLK